MKFLEFDCQAAVKKELQQLKNYDRHSIMIEGSQGSGKTTLAKYFAECLDCNDFQIVAPKVQDLREAIEECYQISTPVVICIENLDQGVKSASYTLLKFLEEPLPHVYIIVTCTSAQRVPDTIVSRSTVLTIGTITREDIQKYAGDKNFELYFQLEKKSIWNIVRSFKDVDELFEIGSAKALYLESLPSLLASNDAVSNQMWKFQKFEDNEPIPLGILIRYIMYTNPKYWAVCYRCLQELAAGQIAQHAVLARFLLDCKYTVR